MIESDTKRRGCIIGAAGVFIECCFNGPRGIRCIFAGRYDVFVAPCLLYYLY
jgi:hypothetical protein